ncbi:MAG: sugar ABC transporter permease [Lachnospiraceae bacterium]|nr:sugar ABC transporter permease [Lachnospiraceae bacterium]
MKKLYGNKLTIFLFLLPALVLFISILIAPIFMSGYVSLFKLQGMNLSTREFVGFDNYRKLFNGGTYDIKVALKNAFLLAGLSVFIQLPLSLALALALGSGRKGERWFLSINFMPVLISAVIIGMLWSKLCNPSYGVMNYILDLLHIERPAGGLLANKNTILGAVFTPVLWQYVGYHMLLMYAGVKSVPPEYREAAMIDGASEAQVNRHIVLPFIKPIIKISVIFAVTGSLKSYDLIAVMIGDTGVYEKAYVPSISMQRYLFKFNQFGLGSAVATMLIVLCFIFALIIGFVFREKED